MRSVRSDDPAEKISAAFVNLMEVFERWDRMHYLGLARQEWVEFTEELDRFVNTVKEVDNSMRE